MLNELIDCKENQPDDLVRPSDVGHEIFQYADQLFVTNRDLFFEEKGLVDPFVVFERKDF